LLLGIFGVVIAIALLLLLRRVSPLVTVAIARVSGRLRVAPQRVILTVLGVAIAIGLMVSVTGVAAGLASQAVIESEDVDYWMVPEGTSASSVSVSAGGVKLGNVHSTAQSLNNDDRIEYATPVLLTLLPFEDPSTGEQTYVLTVGLIPDTATANDVYGLSPASLTPHDPYYADGTYIGTWTGELVVNDAASSLLNASSGSQVTSSRAPNREFTITNVSASQAPSLGGNIPIALMHLSELQSISGSRSGDQANQILISTNNRIRDDLEAQYPDTTITQRSGLNAQEVSTSNLPLAIATAALISALVIGILFVTTLMGIEVNASRQELGMLSAMGFSRRSRSLIVATETIIISLLGGIIGIVFGFLGIQTINMASARFNPVNIDTVARFDPRLVVYALVIAAFIGLVGSLYPVVLSVRTTQLEVLRN
jgi:putative ABC transport system permease protein